MLDRKEFDNFLNTLSKDHYYYLSTYFTMGEIINSALSFSWQVGGASGGDCWGSEAEEWYDWQADGKEEIKQLKDNLKAILDNFCPDVTVEQVWDLTVMDGYCNTEYYGNYDDYQRVYINEDKLFEFINKARSIVQSEVNTN